MLRVFKIVQHHVGPIPTATHYTAYGARVYTYVCFNNNNENVWECYIQNDP